MAGTARVEASAVIVNVAAASMAVAWEVVARVEERVAAARATMG